MNDDLSAAEFWAALLEFDLRLDEIRIRGRLGAWVLTTRRHEIDGATKRELVAGLRQAVLSEQGLG